MVQIANASRYNTPIKFGSDNKVLDQNGIYKMTFKEQWITLSAPWSLSTNQMIQREGLNLTNTVIVAVHHRPNSFWQNIKKAQIDDVEYEVVDMNQDFNNLPTSADLITLKQVKKHG